VPLLRRLLRGLALLAGGRVDAAALHR